MNNQNARGFVVFGPTRSGKTNLLGSLHLAARNVPTEGDTSLDIVKASPDLLGLFRLFGAALTRAEGVPPIDGTYAVARYRFALRTSRRRLLMPTETLETPFQVVDAPGATLLPAPGCAALSDEGWGTDEHRGELVAELAQARGFVLCVDPTAEEDLATYFIELPPLLEEVAQRRTQPFERGVVCLTKADRYFHERGNRARGDAYARDPSQVLARVLSPMGMSSLVSLCRRPAALGVCWTSVLGFLPDGCSNFEVETGGLKHTAARGGFAAAAAAWQPFNVLDPFLFAATGRADGVTVIPT